MSIPRVILQQTGIPGYRVSFLRALKSSVPDLTVVAGDTLFQPSIRAHADVDGLIAPARNHFLLQRRLLWQSGALRALIRADVSVLAWSPRILSNWVVLFARCALRRPTLLWGHAWPRRGAQARTVGIRFSMAALASGIVTYTHEQAEQIRHRVGRPVTAAPNAVLPASSMSPAQPGGPDFLFLGRMVQTKRPDLVCSGFLSAAERLPGARLHMVGDGPLLDGLKERFRHPRILFHGYLPMGPAVATIAQSCLASVSGGYVGLSVIDSLGLGVPVVYPDDEPHSPESEALRPSNSIRFRARDQQSLADALVRMSQDQQHWLAQRELISADTASRYSAEAMASGMANAIKAACGRFS